MMRHDIMQYQMHLYLPPVKFLGIEINILIRKDKMGTVVLIKNYAKYSIIVAK